MESDVNHPPPGKRIHLIRWAPSDAGWVSEVRAGRYLGPDDADWLLDVDGEHQRLPRTEWQRFVPKHDQPAPTGREADVLTIRATARPIMEPPTE
ncbi:hypothetical protein [Agromyces indicus]|uniref:Uncharacterized protein n=1 Tax=Agromyces indicus TaxID=758919 RepID=A0ABU1FLR4_9MICO|nr:hypothetical protein [Agromyces indicus]MDR5692659.1 hypothetical protein [Agromyces indicus]